MKITTLMSSPNYARYAPEARIGMLSSGRIASLQRACFYLPSASLNWKKEFKDDYEEGATRCRTQCKPDGTKNSRLLGLRRSLANA